MTTFRTPQRVVALAAVWLCASASASTLSADVYAGGEALAPEVEAQLIAQTTGHVSRAEVQQALADAQAAGTLAAAGEMSDTPKVIQARLAFNDHQTQTLLAQYEAQRQQQQLALQRAAQAEALRVADASAQDGRAASTEPDAAPGMAANDPSATFASGNAAADEGSALTEPTIDQLVDEAMAPDTPLQAPTDEGALMPATPPMARPDDARVEHPITGPVDASTLDVDIDTE